ncbi:MAG: TlyA family RNA methyltransferase [Pseudomonadota bacterium]|nr:TlyA family RNA methyltransferase [Pseudomonadota bacterium]
MRADQFLTNCGLAATRSQAQRLIAAGVQWRLSPAMPWQKVAKNGDEIPAGAQVQLLDAAEAKYLSRGGLKLEGALAATGVPVQGRHCLDVGQSTGGFTDCLLQHGAAQVVGVDVGQGQLHERLRADARVIAVEGCNARHLTLQALQQACEDALSEQVEAEPDDNDTQPTAPYAWMRNGGVVDDDYDDSDDAKEHDIEAFKAERAAKAKARAAGALPMRRQRRAGREQVAVPTRFDVIVGDLSFISLTLVLPALVPLLALGGDVLLLVKPQFELQPGQVGKGGIVRDAALYTQVEQRLRAACASAGLAVLAWLPSPIDGGDGNREFFIHARRVPAAAAD